MRSKMARGALFGLLFSVCVHQMYAWYSDTEPVFDSELGKLKRRIHEMAYGRPRTYLEKYVQRVVSDTRDKGLSPSQKTKVKEALDYFIKALPKFKSDDVHRILGGIQDMLTLATIATGGPAGTCFGVVSGLFASFMSLLTPQKIRECIGKIIGEAMKNSYDNELEHEVQDIKDKFAEYKRAQDRFRDGVLSSNRSVEYSDFDQLRPHGKVFEHIRFLGILSKRLKNISANNTKRSFVYVVLYEELCKFHLIFLIDVFCLVRLTEKMKVTAHMVVGVLEESKANCRDKLEFLRLHATDPSQFGVLGHYYPANQGQETRDLDDFLDVLNIPRVGALPITSQNLYVVAPVLWPAWMMCAVSRQQRDSYMGNNVETKNSVEGCKGSDNKKLWTGLYRVKGGFYEVLVANVGVDLDGKTDALRRDKLCVYDDHGTLTVSQKAWGKSDCGEDEVLFRLIPLEQSSRKFLIAPKKSPGRFIFMENNPEGTIKLAWKDPGKQGYWKIF